jgi:pimeloyl-ACP methyl ester carboxylesterase
MDRTQRFVCSQTYAVFLGMLAAALLTLFSGALGVQSTNAARQPPAREHFQRADVLYDWVSNSRGDKLRNFITRPKGSSGKVPVIFFVGWLSCDSVEYPDPGTKDGFGILLRRLIDESNYATVRMDKPGVGESQGTPCDKADFQSELEGYDAAFDAMSKYDFIDLERVFMVGLSNGGGVTPLVSRQHPIRGFVAASSWGRTWYEHMLEMERLRLTQAKQSPAEVNEAVKAFTDFYNLYLAKGMTPGQVLGQHPEWKNLWYDSPDGQYGRPAAFYQQLQALNLGQVWQSVNAPVLVIRGTTDSIMSHADSVAIAESVNQVHPGHARYLEVPGMSHGFTINKQFYGDLVPTILEWMRAQLQNQQ